MRHSLGLEIYLLSKIHFLISFNCYYCCRPQLRDIQWWYGSTGSPPEWHLLVKNGSFNFRATKLIIQKLTLNDFDGNYSCCYRTKCSQSNYTLKVRGEGYVHIITCCHCDAAVLKFFYKFPVVLQVTNNLNVNKGELVSILQVPCGNLVFIR